MNTELHRAFIKESKKLINKTPAGLRKLLNVSLKQHITDLEICLDEIDRLTVMLNDVENAYDETSAINKELRKRLQELEALANQSQLSR